MFSFLKNKLKGALERISKKIEQAPEVPVEERKVKKSKVQKEKVVREKKVEEKIAVLEPTPAVKKQAEPEEKKGFFSKIFKKKEVIEEEKKEAVVEEQPEEKKKGILSRIAEKIVTTQISPEQFDELFVDLEMVLLENNVALSVIDKIKDNLKGTLVNVPIKRGKVFDTIKISLHDSIEHLFAVEKVDLLQKIKNTKERPFVIVFVGVNGSGKTTSIAKIAYLLKQHKVSCLMAAGDTWRAASIQQLEEHGRNLGVRVVKQDYGSDSAAVSFDAISAARAHNIDVVLVDTAGRQHSNKNLMEEMKKIIRVAKPHLKIFVAESLTGNDAVEQGREFNEAIGIDGIILTKSDVDEKGGAALSITYVTGKPILYMGVGQRYQDMSSFHLETFLKSVGL